MKSIFVIYDTTWLLSACAHWTFDYLPGWVKRHLIIPDEIKQQVKHHLDYPGEDNLSKAIHTHIADIMGDEGYLEMENRDLPPCPFSAGYFGAISQKGRKIVALAFHLVSSDSDCFVYVNTYDGGIQSELSLLYSQKKLPVFSQATINEFHEFIGCQNFKFCNLYT